MRELTLAEFDLIVGGDATTVSPVIVTGGGGGWGGWDYGGGGYGGDGGGSNTNTGDIQPVSFTGDLLNGIFGSYWFTPQAILERNASTQYDEAHHTASTWVTTSLLGVPVTFELKYMDDGSFYIDYDKNGTPESHFAEFHGEIFIDSNNDGSFDTLVGPAG